MKKVFLGIGLLASMGLGGLFDTSANADVSEVYNTSIPSVNFLWREYNPNTGEHFLTESFEETEWLEEQGWITEGLAWMTPISGEEVYRLYNPNAGDHFYTKSIVEYNWLKQQGWIQEGRSFFSSEGKDTAVYRSYNKNAVAAGSHMFTINKDEHDGLLRSGWLNEDVQFYAVSMYTHLETLTLVAESITETEVGSADFAKLQQVIAQSHTVLNKANISDNELRNQYQTLYDTINTLNFL